MVIGPILSSTFAISPKYTFPFSAGTGMLFISFIKNPSLPLNFTVISVSCPRLFGSLANTSAFLPDTAAEKDFITLARVVP